MLTGLLVYALRVFFSERLRGIPLPGPASAALPGSQAPYPWPCRMALRLSGLRGPLTGSYLPGPVSAAPPGKISGSIPVMLPGGGWRLTRPTFLRPVVNLFTMVAETAGADGLKIAETFPEGRGSPHGCGLRAVFCRDAASARPEACRDKSKVPRSGDFAGRSPGVQGAAATGRPLCAPCAVRDITQKINRERKFH